MGRFEEQNRILDMVFHGKLKRAAALIALHDTGVSAEEAKRLISDAVRLGKKRREAAKEGAGK